ncbi:hypothetical protein KBX71_31775 [Micromonospora sp. D93]|uniref:hypothetical protein n=1 Tax=Micromonospora sp. D93 TaxID=2824886 RepID=UPI001B37990A|nr:hypothetical protein [Micromonospora sp. D93]MBQ1022428.1 hypothetical protein [Micromonospora sp. D93]
MSFIIAGRPQCDLVRVLPEVFVAARLLDGWPGPGIPALSRRSVTGAPGDLAIRSAVALRGSPPRR